MPGAAVIALDRSVLRRKGTAGERVRLRWPRGERRFWGEWRTVAATAATSRGELAAGLAAGLHSRELPGRHGGCRAGRGRVCDGCAVVGCQAGGLEGASAAREGRPGARRRVRRRVAGLDVLPLGGDCAGAAQAGQALGRGSSEYQ